ncbi:MAG: single-stranded DNA-binding protein, partial [Burkholderiaceae bacterium]|nr:single-stranded DNA-binding protein [Burkholderiaceae bacterium]
EFEDESPINPFDLWEGANFKLKIVKKDGYWNYDKSEFGSVEPLLDDDDALEALWKKEYSLTAVTAPDQFKSYEELEKRLKMVLGQKSTNRRMDEEVEDEDNDRGSYTSESNEIKETFNSLDSSSEDEDDALSYFQKLAE